MRYLPIFVDLKGKPCLVVGGGEVASRRCEQLLRAAGRVTVVAPERVPALQALHERGDIQYLPRSFIPQDLDGVFLVSAATDDGEVNREISRLAQAQGRLVNVVDDPGLCNFLMPSIVDRSPVQIAISTGGASPVLARLLRARLETLIPSAYGRLAALMADFRGRVKQRLPDQTARRRFWEVVLDGPIAEMLFAGQDRAALAALEGLMDDTACARLAGEVYLVGAGPGDPDLLTFRALRLMQRADVVLYDRLVAPAVLDLVRKDAERIYVGKARDRHTLRQDEINGALVRLARQGKRVLRLKGGDPFVFGRGGEEIGTLAEQGIPFQIVPGITAASGCACYAGIPLTHRDYAQACIFAAGHLKDGRLDLNWQALVHPNQTVAIYMGIAGLELLCAGLIAHGMRPDMPAALIHQGTTPHQQVIVGTLQDLAQRAQARALGPPSLVIVGEVVRLHERLAWFDPAPAVDSG